MDRLALIEVLDHDGHVQHTVPVTRWPVTVGRSIDCDVVLHDPYVAARHAVLHMASDAQPGLRLTVGDTVNGVRWDGCSLLAGASAPLPSGRVWHAGRSALRVRLPGEALAPEQPLALPQERRSTRVTLGLASLLALWTAGTLWLDKDPGTHWEAYLPQMLALVSALTLWCCLWGLGSRLFQRRFTFMPHLRIAAMWGLLALVADALLALGSFALPWPGLSQVRGWVAAAIFAVVLAGHMRLVLPGRARMIGTSLAMLWAAVFVVSTALTWQRSDRLFNELYAATLAPPSLRLANAQPPSALIEELKLLQRNLDRRAKTDEDKDAEPH